jgi:hypothetical protein
LGEKPSLLSGNSKYPGISQKKNAREALTMHPETVYKTSWFLLCKIPHFAKSLYEVGLAHWQAGIVSGFYFC